MGKRFFFWLITLMLAGRLMAAESAPVDVSADRMEYVGEQLVAEGNVVVVYGEDKMEADHVTVDPASGDCYAQGSVRFSRGEYTWEGEEVHYNFKTGVGEFGEFKVTAGAYRITAEDSRRVDEHEIWLKGVTMTTCEEDDVPYYSIRIKECRLIDEHLIKAKHASIWLGKMPVFYLPYIKRNLNGSLVNTQVGRSSDLGPFVRNIITYDIDDNIQAKSHVDLYSKRGFGFGQDLWARYDRGEIDLGFYYINDSRAAQENDIGSTHPDADLYDSERYRVRVDATSSREEDEKDYLKAHVNAWSDPDIVENFFPEEYRVQSQPETIVGVARSDDQSTVGLTTVYQFSEAYDSVNRLPELSFDLYRKMLPGGLFYHSESELSYLEKRDNNYVVVPDEYEALRFDTFHELERPFQVFDFLNVTPRASYRGTLYSDGPQDEHEFRNLFELGTEASFKAYKVLTDTPGWYGEGLRHMVQPYANYTYRPTPGLQPANIYSGAASELFRFDEIDDFDEANEIAFGLRNVLQTRRNKNVRKFMDLDLYTAVDLDPEVGQRQFDTLNGNLEFWINDHLNAELEAEYNFYTQEFNPVNVRLESTLDNGTYFRTEYRWRDNFSNMALVEATLWPKNKYSLDTYARYDFDDEQFDDSNIILKRKFDCIGTGLGFRHKESDNQVWVYMWIREFGEESAVGR